MKVAWVFGLSFSASHLLFRLGIAQVRALFLLLGPCFILPYACELASVPAMSLHCSCYDITYPFISLLPLGLRVETPAMSISYILSSFGFYCPAFLLGQPIPSLRFPWLISFLRLPRPISFLGHLGPFHSLGSLGPFPSSFTSMGFC